MKIFIQKFCSLRTFGPALLAMGAILLTPTAAWSDDRRDDPGMAERAGEVVTDSAITAQVKTRLLANTNVPGTDINVDTRDGTVTLSGTVSDEAEKDLAYYIAKSSRGVKDVKNELSVKK